MKRYVLLTTFIAAAWFAVALSLGALQVFRNDSQRVGLSVAIAAFTPLVLFSIWYTASREFRKFLFSLNPKTLTLVQTWRVLGIVFVLLQLRGLLPALFAKPAGYGDMFIGITAPLAALALATPAYRSRFIAWQLLGLADLIMAVSLGITARVFVPGDATMLPMTVLPLSLVPTLIVPLLAIFHLICIAQAKAWKTSAGGIRKHAEVAERTAA